MTTALPLDRAGIEAILPHREPFLLIDEVLELVPGERVVALKRVREDEWYLRGHFPGRPVMPGVLIVEAMAQTSAVLMSKSLAIDPAGKAIFFMSLDNCRFRAPVRPGAVLRMPVEVTQSRRDIYKFKGRAMIGDKVAAEAEWAAMVVDTQ